MALLPIVLLFGLMYVLLIRPQQRRVRQHQAVVAALEVGDEVATAGGMLGTITGLDDETVSLEIAPGTTIRVLRAAVGQRRNAADGGAEAGDAADEERTSHEDDGG
jgi:preprotein translocase subunit YajC